MVIICPQCKVKLKVDDQKLSQAGSRFKCPKCSTALLIKKPSPAAQTGKTLDSKKVLVAHSKHEVIESAAAVLRDHGYTVITSADGIDVMVKALRELPAVALVEVSLPKIYGFELCKKLKMRAETKDMKFILVPAIFDKAKYRREPASLYGADDYIEEQDIALSLPEKISRLIGLPEAPVKKPPMEQKAAPLAPPAPELPKAAAPPPQAVDKEPAEVKSTEAIEKAKRLSRTILNDIYLYNTAKVAETIRNGSFSAVFAGELKEGQKLYENRIPKIIRDGGDYYNETIQEFISKKKKELG